MYKKILVFICCVVLVFKTVKSQIVSVEGVWHACNPSDQSGLFSLKV